jgi:hypothetical protein
MLALIPVMLLVASMCGAFYYWLRQRGLAAEERATPQDRRRASLLTEVMGYIGAALVLAGTSVTVVLSWTATTDWDHAALFAALALFFLTVGLMVFWVSEPAIQRMMSVLWLISTASAGAAAGLAAHDVYAAGGAETGLAVGLAVTLWSAALWLLRRRELQMVGLFAGVTITISAGILVVAGTTVPWLAFALGLWALGIGWVIVAWQYPQPLWSTVPLGTLIALIGPSFAVWQHGWMFVLAIATAAAAMAASIPRRNTLLLAAGTLALFGYIAAAVVRYFHGSLGLPATLASCGVLLIAFALVTAWTLTRPRREDTGGGRPLALQRAPRPAGHAAAQRAPARRAPGQRAPGQRAATAHSPAEHPPTERPAAEHPAGGELAGQGLADAATQELPRAS